MTDYISKEVAIRIIDSERSKEQMLAVLPSAVPADVRENKHGEWMYTKHYGEPYRVCPKCHMERKDDLSRGWNFCPNCGADMREV